MEQVVLHYVTSQHMQFRSVPDPYATLPAIIISLI